MTERTFPPARKIPPATALLLAFLARGPFPETWVLRGSVVTRAHNPRGRDPVDLDYVVTSPAWNPDDVVAGVEAVLRRSPLGHDAVAFGTVRAVPIWEETRFPGIRAYVEADVAGVRDELQVDFGWGDPIVAPLDTIVFHGVGPLRAVCRETMIAWKLHGLVEWGRGRWRPKDLHDLDVLLDAPIDEATTRASLDVAFSSRRTPLSDLGELLYRPAWGESPGRRKTWKKATASLGPTADFFRARARVVGLLERLGLRAELASHEERFRREDEARALTSTQRVAPRR